MFPGTAGAVSKLEIVDHAPGTIADIADMLGTRM